MTPGLDGSTRAPGRAVPRWCVLPHYTTLFLGPCPRHWRARAAAALLQERGRVIGYPYIVGALRVERRKLGWTAPAVPLYSVVGASR